jgi:GTP cyclohydrolase II
VICEIMNDDGTMARLPDLVAFAQRHALKVGTIADLIAYRLRHDRLVERDSRHQLQEPLRRRLPAPGLRQRARRGRARGAGEGGRRHARAVLVRVHAVNILEDLLGEGESGRGDQLHRAMEAIGAAGRGVVVLLREPAPTSISRRVKVSLGQHPPRPRDLRVYGIGAQILADLGVREMILLSNTGRTIVGLEGYGLTGGRDAADRDRGRPLMSGVGEAQGRSRACRGARVLVVEARYYPAINDMLLAGAQGRAPARGARGRPRRRAGRPRDPAGDRHRPALGPVRRLRGARAASSAARRPITSSVAWGELPRADGSRRPRRPSPSATGSSRSRTKARPWSERTRSGQDKGGGAADRGAPAPRLAAPPCRGAGPDGVRRSRSPQRRRRPAAVRRRAARFAAVQALYQIELNGQRPDFVVAEFGEHRLAQLLEPRTRTPPRRGSTRSGSARS